MGNTRKKAKATYYEVSPLRASKSIDSFVSAAGNRLIELVKLQGEIHKPWEIRVFILRSASATPVLLSTSEYYTEESARFDFDRRRPTMHVEEGEVPMQRGKRLVQDMLKEKLP